MRFVVEPSATAFCAPPRAMRSAWRRCAPSLPRRSDATLICARNATRKTPPPLARARARGGEGEGSDGGAREGGAAQTTIDGVRRCRGRLPRTTLARHAPPRDGTSRDARPGDETLRFPFRRRPARERRGGSTLSPVGDSRAFGSRGSVPSGGERGWVTSRRRGSRRRRAPTRRFVGRALAAASRGEEREKKRRRERRRGRKRVHRGEGGDATAHGGGDGTSSRGASGARSSQGVCAAPARGFHASIRGGRRASRVVDGGGARARGHRFEPRFRRESARARALADAR